MSQPPGWKEIQALAASRLNQLFRHNQPSVQSFLPPPQMQPPPQVGYNAQHSQQQATQQHPQWGVYQHRMPFFPAMTSQPPRGVQCFNNLSMSFSTAGFATSSYVQSLTMGTRPSTTNCHNYPSVQPSNLNQEMSKWSNVKPSISDVAEGHMEFTVMTYNVLSQELMENHPYLYHTCDDRVLQWHVRSKAICRLIQSHQPDVICLQEMEQRFWKTTFLPKFKSFGYIGQFMKRTGDKTDGCAILFKDSMFSSVKWVPVSFCKGGYLDRDNVALIAMLRPRNHLYKGDVDEICVATTHLLFNPRRGDVKLAQLMLLLAEIDKHATMKQAARNSSSSNDSMNEKISSFSSVNNFSDDFHPYNPTILCGDFNMEPFSPLYNFVTQGCVAYHKCYSASLSGQKEGQSAHNFSFIPKVLLPSKLKITERCRYASKSKKSCKKCKNQIKPEGDDSDESSSSDLKSIAGQGHSSDPNLLAPGITQYVNVTPIKETKSTRCVSLNSQSSLSITKFPSPDKKNKLYVAEEEELSHTCSLSPAPESFNTGTAYHNLRFKSVYDHVVRDGDKSWEEVSTYHSMACCTCDYIFYSSKPFFNDKHTKLECTYSDDHGEHSREDDVKKITKKRSKKKHRHHSKEERLKCAEGKDHHSKEHLKCAEGKDHHSKERFKCAEGKEHHNKERLKCAEGNEHHNKERLKCAEGEEHHNKERLKCAEGEEHHSKERLKCAEGEEHHSKERLKSAEGKEHHSKERLKCAEGKDHHSKERLKCAEGKDHRHRSRSLKRDTNDVCSEDESPKRRKKSGKHRKRRKSSKRRQDDSVERQRSCDRKGMTGLKTPLDEIDKNPSSNLSTSLSDQTPESTGSSLDGLLASSPEKSSCDDSLNERLVLVSRYNLPTTDFIGNMRFLPNSDQPSDHFCLIAKFVLR